MFLNYVTSLLNDIIPSVYNALNDFLAIILVIIYLRLYHPKLKGM